MSPRIAGKDTRSSPPQHALIEFAFGRRDNDITMTSRVGLPNVDDLSHLGRACSAKWSHRVRAASRWRRAWVAEIAASEKVFGRPFQLDVLREVAKGIF